MTYKQNMGPEMDRVARLVTISKAHIDLPGNVGTIQSIVEQVGLQAILVGAAPLKVGDPDELDVQPLGGNVEMFSSKAKAELNVHGDITVDGKAIIHDNVSIKGVIEGDVTIGTGPAAATVQVNGSIKTTGDVVLTGGDCAEDFDIAQPENVDAGTVMVINEEGALQQSGQAYDKRVAGIISGAGDLRPGVILGKQSTKSGRMPLALVGKVYCKVDAGYSSIEVGDLLTTSPTPGHAMKAKDQALAFGAVIGKALTKLEGGKGLIPVLVALQ
jgi:hypothetical protein